VETKQIAAGSDLPAGVPPELLGTPREVLESLARLLREVRYGSIEITVHEGRVTQIERREKVRLALHDRQR
jgi:hypothetical protein